MLMQPNAHIEYGYPCSSPSSSSSSSSSFSSFSAITPPASDSPRKGSLGGGARQKKGDTEAEAEASEAEASEASDVRPLHIVINLSPSPAVYSA
ncbi:uncharacterized protein BO66DRAFT_392139 [Aspergillus aculeatinus CBS 121060]|uniref:Uncharacterized protein n=1 Tax=Aspergillus aculeatinus CBS 121060 TaxID=1448322 RepID=A0ACD1H7H9_9EURO|nr:hypothetical protein BO66DRAFT_392139 [Aspergillus aculeatinus CBS 121060]RAH69709.1 hypothetical protein BO66DRAFT_392139 [Aspergillus aculeatinus CBS 121060]